jgi:hypothetical protein
MTTPVGGMPLDAYINPFLACAVCSKPVQWHTGDLITNHPCGHRGTYSTCLTWSPAAGCICKERWGSVGHAGPSAGSRPAPAAAAPAAAATVKP